MQLRSAAFDPHSYAMAGGIAPITVDDATSVVYTFVDDVTTLMKGRHALPHRVLFER